jgi:2-oxo-4-hydroxy-4-carboxy-5-ureidoimidazoline decarboxylase
MINARPFKNLEALLAASQHCFSLMNEQDYLCAFEGHPQIGDLTTLQAKYANTSGTASHEQSGMSSADNAVLEEMVRLNKDYLAKFGFIFIVCASGKTASEMLQLIKDRIANDRSAELMLAGKEQSKITALRLEKL